MKKTTDIASVTRTTSSKQTVNEIKLGDLIKSLKSDVHIKVTYTKPLTGSFEGNRKTTIKTSDTPYNFDGDWRMDDLRKAHMDAVTQRDKYFEIWKDDSGSVNVNFSGTEGLMSCVKGLDHNCLISGEVEVLDS